MADRDIPVVTGVQVLPSMVPATPITGGFEQTSLPEASRRILTEQGYTAGLIEALEKNCKRAFANSIWVVDNSGSMQTQDGQRIVVTKKNYKFTQSTRWAEMQQTVDYHANLAALLEFPTTFRLLNDPGRVAGPQIFTVSTEFDLKVARTTMDQAQPAGVTPLSRHLREIRDYIRSMEATLKQNGTKVNVTLATDGIPTDDHGHSDDKCKQDFMNAMQDLEGLPVWIVVRLCTDDESVVDFWNQLDKNMEISLEVLDDFPSEAAEVHKQNPWINYTLPLHRMREIGFYHSVFDVLDERPLSKSEMVDFLKLVFGQQTMMEVPDPDADWKAFSSKVASINAKGGKQFDAIQKKMLPWIDMKKLNKSFGSGGLFGLF